MPSGKVHMALGIIIIIVAYFVLDLIGLSDGVGYAVPIIVGAIIPDILEPAIDYTHRGYLHSKTFLKYLYYALVIFFLIGLFLHWFLYLFFFVVGYISHLWLDSTTPMGLPK